MDCATGLRPAAAQQRQQQNCSASIQGQLQPRQVEGLLDLTEDSEDEDMEGQQRLAPQPQLGGGEGPAQAEAAQQLEQLSMEDAADAEEPAEATAEERHQLHFVGERRPRCQTWLKRCRMHPCTVVLLCSHMLLLIEAAVMKWGTPLPYSWL